MAKRTIKEQARYDYGDFYERLLARLDTPRVSDRDVGRLLDVSERVVRKARFEGMDPYTADHFCTKGLGMHPAFVYGHEAWLTAEAYFAEEIFDGEVDVAELPSAHESEEKLWESMKESLDAWS